MTLTCFMRWRRGKIRSSLVEFRHVLDDIQTLNQKARAGEYELTAVSYHAYPLIADKYRLMASGSSVGDGYGPLVVAPHPDGFGGPERQAHRDSGKLTTAYLTLRLMQPDFEAVEVPFDKILDAVREGRADAGLVIHEAQLTYSHSGFHKVVDHGPLVEGQVQPASAAGRERAAAGFVA